jgi:hypothetical protein
MNAELERVQYGAKAEEKPGGLGMTRPEARKVVHYLDRSTGLNVIADPVGNFIGGWRLGPDQLKSVITSGRLF